MTIELTDEERLALIYKIQETGYHQGEDEDCALCSVVRKLEQQGATT